MAADYDYEQITTSLLNFIYKPVFHNCHFLLCCLAPKKAFYSPIPIFPAFVFHSLVGTSPKVNVTLTSKNEEILGRKLILTALTQLDFL